jgi:hypothetical protein
MRKHGLEITEVACKIACNGLNTVHTIQKRCPQYQDFALSPDTQVLPLHKDMARYSTVSAVCSIVCSTHIAIQETYTSSLQSIYKISIRLIYSFCSTHIALLSALRTYSTGHIYQFCRTHNDRTESHAASLSRAAPRMTTSSIRIPAQPAFTAAENHGAASCTPSKNSTT